MNLTRSRIVLGALCLSLCSASSVSAQVFGNFSWQMQPYCNVVSLTLTSTPAGFTLDGTDDQCGAANKASALGVATFNAGGLVNVNFTIVTAPSGKAVHVAAIVNPANGNGTWTDSVGNSGTFAIGVSSGGSPRPLPVSGIGASVITTTEIAAGAVSGTDINSAEVQARVTGICPAGQAVRSIGQDGAVVCEPTALAAVRFRAATADPLNLAANSFLTLTFSSLSYNVGGGTYTPAAGTYVVPSTGTYLLSASANFLPSSNVNGHYCLGFWVGGLEAHYTCAAQTATFVVPNVSTVMELTAGQTVAVRAFNGSTGTQTVFGSGATSGFTVTRMQ